MNHLLQTSVLSAAFAMSSPATPAHAPVRFAAKQAPTLYASDFLNGAIEEYRQSGRSQRPFHSISGPSASIGLAVDGSGDLYAAQPGAIWEYAPGGSTPTKIFDDSGHDPGGVAICPNGTLYAANSEGDSISVYAGGSIEPTGTLLVSGQVFHAACDAASDLFVTASGTFGVVEFPANGSGPVGLPISFESFPEGIAVDRAGDVVVANGAELDFYTIGQSTPFKTLPVEGTAIELSFSEHDKTVWVATSDRILRYAVATGRLTDTIQLTAGGIAASPED